MTKEEVENRIVAVSPNLFRRFFKGDISWNDCEKLGKVFAEHMHQNVKAETLKKILPESMIDVILKSDHPFYQHGYHGAFVLHLTDWFSKAKTEATEEGS